MKKPRVKGLLQITAQGFMEHRANEQLPPVGSCHRGAYDHFAIISVHLGHDRLIRMNVLDAKDLWKTKSQQ